MTTMTTALPAEAVSFAPDVSTDVELVTFPVASVPGSARDRTKVLVTSIEGELNVGNRQHLKQDMLDELHVGRRRFVFDMTTCGYIDSSGLGVLLSIARKVQFVGGRFVLAGLNEDLRTLFELTKMGEVFELADTLQAALAGFGS